MKILLILDFPSQTSCLGKIFFWSYCLKCGWSIRFQDFSSVMSVKKIEGKFLRVSAVAFGVRGQACPKYPKQKEV